MTARSTPTEARAGASRPSSVEPPARGGRFLLVAAWLLLIQAIHAVLLMFEDVMDGEFRWPVWAYLVVAAVATVGGAALYTSTRWGYFVALVSAAVAGLTIFPPPTGGFVVFAVLQLVVLAVGFRAAGRLEAIQLDSAGIRWGVKLGLVQALIVMTVVRVLIALRFDTEWIRENAWNIISRGVPTTLLISAVAIILAIVLALFGALGRLSRNPVAFGVAGFYTSFFRGTPLLVQLFLAYLGLAQIGIQMRGTPLQPFGQLITLTSLTAAILAIGFNYGAYMTEIFRAGIQSVGHGQGEAAEAIGMTYGQKMRRVVLPQAVRVIIPPTGNEFIAMLKDSSLAFTIGVIELFRSAELAGRRDFRSLEALVIAAAIYWAVTGVLTFFQARLERKMGRGYVRAGTAGTTRTARKTFLPAPGTGAGGGRTVAMDGSGEDEEEPS
jgi:polar amino acid transport system permease protein